MEKFLNNKSLNEWQSQDETNFYPKYISYAYLNCK